MHLSPDYCYHYYLNFDLEVHVEKHGTSVLLLITLILTLSHFFLIHTFKITLGFFFSAGVVQAL